MQKQTCVLLLSSLAALSWQHAAAETVSMSPDNFMVVDEKHRFEKHLERDALFLSGGGEGGSFALLKALDGQAHGTLEFDVAMPAQYGFVGAVFRMQSNFVDGEMVYMRVHRSGYEDAAQYMPVFSGQESWQLYYTPGQYAQNITYDFDQWMHVKIAVADGVGEWYVKDMEKPAMVMPLTHRAPAAGAWGLYATVTEQGAYYSNVSYSTEKPQLKHSAIAPEKTPAGTLLRWHISDAFAEKELGDGHTLPKSLQTLKWQAVDAETSGLVHLSAIHGAAMFEGNNTVFAKVNLHAKEAGVKRLDLGFSDRVKAYLNGQLLFSANDQERTRDERFLGSLGYFDALYLPLKQGDNELWLAISESSGGWGLKAKLDDLSGIEVK